MRLAQPGPNGPPPADALAPQSPCPGVEAIFTTEADDEKTPNSNTIYFLKDITPLVESSTFYDEDVAAHKSTILSISWVICAYINGRDKSSTTEGLAKTHLLPTPPSSKSILVVNGSTPRPDKEQDYHDWYDQEHGNKLTLVPGWNSARRYSLQKVYGETETASFYGFNYYDAENGLGGPEWKAGVTEWTMRIRSNAAKPNIRRVWRVQDTKSI